jgi:hypothetical protein
MTTEYAGKEDDVSMLNNDQLARAEALRMARAVLEARGVGGSFLTPGSIQPGKAYDITSMANWIITGRFGLVAVGPTPVMDYYEARPQETAVERTEPDDAPSPDVATASPGAPSWVQDIADEMNKQVRIPELKFDRQKLTEPIVWKKPSDDAEHGAAEVNFEIPEDERERLNASGRSASINIDAVKDTETRQAAPDPEDGWP